jgi:hypothetical protein
MRDSLLHCSYVSFVPQKVIPDPRLGANRCAPDRTVGAHPLPNARE